MKFPVRGEAGFLFLLMMKNFTHPVISLRGTHWKCLMIPEPSQRRQDIKEWLTDRQTDSELHVKSPFPFKKKITLKHRRTRGSTHTRIPTQRKDPTTPPPPSLYGEILSPPEDIYVATSIFLQIFFISFFFILFKRLVLKHNQACFCIIRASGCIWRQTNDSSAFRLKREPLLIYANRYIDR